MNKANSFLDNGTFSFEIKAMEGLREVNVLNVNVTKKMPTASDKNITFKENQWIESENYTHATLILPVHGMSLLLMVIRHLQMLLMA